MTTRETGCRARRTNPVLSPAVVLIIDHCRAASRYKCPAAVEFGELPKTSMGKVQKFLLREREWAGRERRIS